MQSNVLYVDKVGVALSSYLSSIFLKIFLIFFKVYSTPEEVLLLTDEINEVPYSVLNFEGEIGRGAFGCVYKASIKPNHPLIPKITVAVKILRDQPNDIEKQEFDHEIHMMKICGRHENVVKFLGICKQPKLCIIMEHIPCGDLLSYLRSLRDIYVENRQLPIGKSSASYILPNDMQSSAESPPLTPLSKYILNAFLS